MRAYPVVLAATTLIVVACGDDDSPTTSTTTDGSAMATSNSDPDQLYTSTVTVLESPEHGPQLCLGGVNESLPPQCGGPDIEGWNWDDAEGHESVSGTMWGVYTVVGRYLDGVFTLSEPPSVPNPDDPVSADAPQFETPCDEPDGGWQVVDEATATDAGMNDALDYANSQTEFAGAYLDQSINPALADEENMDAEDIEMAANDPTKLILNIRFTADVERHEQEIRKVWGGALCVSMAEHSTDELIAIQDELHNANPDVLGSGIDETSGYIDLQVIVDDGSLQAELDETYGPGVVVVQSALRPVS